MSDRCCSWSSLLSKTDKVFRNASEAARKEHELYLQISTADLSFCDLTFSSSYLQKQDEEKTQG